MSTTEITVSGQERIALERLLIKGDLKLMTFEQKAHYYTELCRSVGLNPLTRPFEFITLQGKETLYAKKDCTDQLRASRGVSVKSLKHDFQKDLELYVVTAVGSLPDGREDTGTGAVNVAGKKGDDLANAIMKAETKAKRRLTLSICGLGILDESELDTIKGAKPGSGSKTNRVVEGTVDQIKVTDHGVTGVKIGDEKLWISDAGIDSQLAASEGQPVTVECAERSGPTGKTYWEIVRVLRIRNFDFTDPGNLVPQLKAGLAKAQDEICGFCGQKNGHESTCNFAAKPGGVSTATVEPSTASNAPQQPANRLAVRITKVITRTKKPLRIIEVLTDAGQVDMSVWHEHLHPILDGLQKVIDDGSKQVGMAVIEYSEKEKDGRIWSSLEKIIELDGVPLNV